VLRARHSAGEAPRAALDEARENGQVARGLRSEECIVRLGKVQLQQESRRQGSAARSAR